MRWPTERLTFIDVRESLIWVMVAENQWQAASPAHWISQVNQRRGYYYPSVIHPSRFMLEWSLEPYATLEGAQSWCVDRIVQRWNDG